MIECYTSWNKCIKELHVVRKILVDQVYAYPLRISDICISHPKVLTNLKCNTLSSL